MTHAYDHTYLEKAETALARMLDFAVYDLQYDITEFMNLFISSGVADRFGSGEFTVIVGMSGVELAYEVLDKVNIEYTRIKPKYPVERSEEYWTGYALAYYQWYTAISFENILSKVPITRIRDLYHPYHEMDIRQFRDKMDELMG